MTTSDVPSPEDWADFAEEVNESVVQAFERNLEAQSTFVDAWMDAIDTGVEDSAGSKELAASYAQAYNVWMDAVESQYEEFITGIESGDVNTEAIRDSWLQAANESFKEVMETTAFAQHTGKFVEDALALQRESDVVAADTVRQLGFASRDDIVEVGERLVELERRQHAVEKQLNRIAKHLED